MPYSGLTNSERFWSHVEKTDGCWYWTGDLTAGGYGQFQISLPWRRRCQAHRFAYEEMVTPIPADMQLDHLCHTESPDCFEGDACLHRRCVRPDHLELVTREENRHRARRKKMCLHGHLFDGANNRGDRFCRTCAREASKRYRARRAV